MKMSIARLFSYSLVVHMSDPELRLGTRGSLLALTQANLVLDMLASQLPNPISITTIATEGDLTQGSLAHPIRPGVFVSAVRDALRAGEVDLIVHSFKDLPSATTEGLVIAAVPEREDARDVVLSRTGRPLAELPTGARVGTSSPRRTARIRALRPDVECVPIRGNVDTRISKMHTGEFDAIVLAAAGLNRLGRGSEITEYLTTDDLLPAPGQGALAVEVRAGDAKLIAALGTLMHHPTLVTVSAERAVLHNLGASCRTAVGALATVDADGLHLRAELSDGRSGLHERRELSTPDASPASAAELGRTVAGLLLATQVGQDLVGYELRPRKFDDV
jgi:hydroxymethylbilane synthase